MTVNNADGGVQPGWSNPVAYLRAPSTSRTILIGCCVVAIVIVAALVAAPIGVAHYVEGWLRDNGATSAQVEDVDINLFTGVVRVSGLDAGGGPRARLHVGSAALKLRWLPLLSQRIHVQSLQLADTQVDLVAREGGDWQIGALLIRNSEKVTPAREAEVAAVEAFPWGFGSEIVHITNVMGTYRDSEFDVEADLRELRVGSQFSWDADRTTEVLLDVSIDGSPLVLRSDVAAWADERQFKGVLKLGDLNLAGYRQALLKFAGLGQPEGSITLDLDVSASYGTDGVLNLLIAGLAETANVGFRLNDVTVASQSLRWEGDLVVQLPAPDEGTLVRAEGALQLAHTRAALADLELDVGLESLDWRGEMGFSPPGTVGSAPDVFARSQVIARGFKLNHLGLPVVLVALDELVAADVQVDALTRGSVQQVQVQGLRLLGERAEGAARKPDVLALAGLEINGVIFESPAGLSVETMTLREPMVWLARNEQGELDRIDAVIAAFTTDGAPGEGMANAVEAEAEAVEPAAIGVEAPTKFTVADLKVQATTVLSFLDNSVAPPARFKLSTMELGIQNVDSTGGKPMQVHLVTGDGSMKLSADGVVNAFAQTLSADLAVQLEALELPPVSSYVPGYNIERGQLSSKSNVVIKAGVVDVTNALLIDRLKLAGKAEEDSGLVAQGMAMPLDVALDLLRDGDDRIKLNVPITGSVADPKFGTGDIVATAMKKALQNGAMYYVKNALQPLGTLLLVGKLATRAARPRFVPVQMAPGESSLSATAREYLQKLGALLRARPGLKLTICGVATPTDRDALIGIAMDQAAREAGGVTSRAGAPAPGSDAATGESAVAEEPVVTDAELLELSSLRTAALILFLVDEEKVARNRLFACRETIEQSDDEGPRVDISL